MSFVANASVLQLYFLIFFFWKCCFYFAKTWHGNTTYDTLLNIIQWKAAVFFCTPVSTAMKIKWWEFSKHEENSSSIIIFLSLITWTWILHQSINNVICFSSLSSSLFSPFAVNQSSQVSLQRSVSTLVPSVSNHHWNHVILTLCFTASAKDLFSKCQNLHLTAEKKEKMNLFNSPLQSFSLPTASTTTVTQREGRINMGLCCFVGWSLPVLPWLSTLTGPALKCSLLMN